MNWNEEFRTAAASLVENVVNSPRLAASVGTVTGALGGAVKLDLINGILSTTGIIAGIVMTLLLARLHWVNVQNGLVQNKILLAQLAAMGVEPLTEKPPEL